MSEGQPEEAAALAQQILKETPLVSIDRPPTGPVYWCGCCLASWPLGSEPEHKPECKLARYVALGGEVAEPIYGWRAERLPERFGGRGA